MLKLLKIKPEERWLTVVALAVIGALNAIVTLRYFPVMSGFYADYHSVARDTLQLSGFDAWSWSVISDWNGHEFNVFRHPLLALYCLPLYLLNQLLIWITGVNCAIILMAIVETAFGTYAAVFLFRILREVIGCRRTDATLLTLLFFTFAFITITVMVPDHFNVSMCLLLAVLYVCGMHLKAKKPLGIMQTVAMFLLSAGVSLTNGVKVGLAALFTNGRKTFRLKYLLLALIVPAAAIWAIANVENQLWAEPLEKVARAERQARDKAFRDSILQATRLKHPDMDSAEVRAAAKKEHRRLAYIQYLHNHEHPKIGRPMSKEGFLIWTDRETSRWRSIKENLFGESIQLHKANLLEDIMKTERPMIVPYEADYHYAIELLPVLLALAGAVIAVRSRFFWLLFSWFLFDMAIYLGLGFGINELYLMTSQWAFIMPISMAYLFRSARPQLRWPLRAVVGALAAYLIIYNVPLILGHLWQ